ncbi:MAG: VWA domain-containing protein [SAR324 cluster bacterium]|nr:VWA domain-containing protein [SAR324 cluster bacterium]
MKTLHFIWIADCSGSMNHSQKIQTLNKALHSSIPLMREVADRSPLIDVRVRAIEFSNKAEWHISQPTPPRDLVWIDLKTGGRTNMSMALDLITAELDQLMLQPNTLPPILILISDGQPENRHLFESSLKALISHPLGKRTYRYSIAIGEDANQEVLREFAGKPEWMLDARDISSITHHIQWISKDVLETITSYESNPYQVGPRRAFFTGNLKGLRPLMIGGVWAVQHYHSILKIFNQDPLLKLFAEPDLSHLYDKEIAYFTTHTGPVQSFSQLDQYDQLETLRTLKDKVQTILTFIRQLPETDQASIRQLIEQSLEIPSMNELYLIGRQVTLILWGFQMDSFRPPSRLLLNAIESIS